MAETLVEGLHKLKEKLKLQDIISWAVWNEFSAEPATGWMREINQAIRVKKSDPPKKEEQNEKL